MARVVFVTPNQGRQAEVQRLLADVEIELSRFGPVAPPELNYEAAARARAALAFAQLGRPCFVENTAFELEGEGELRGAELKRLMASLGGEEGFCRAYGGRRAAARVAVALCESGAAGATQVFSGGIEGEVASAPRGDEGWGWDRVFAPEGYARTLGELGASKYLVNMRHGPYLDLADHLRGRRAGGAYEAHVTVRAAPGEAPRFREACDALGVKCVLIELPAGEHAAQPMTASVHRGVLREVQGEVHALARAIVARGFEVVRTKIEALPRNADWPETDEDAAARPAGYFEYHVKLALPAGDEASLARVRDACEPLGARLSRNAGARRREGEEDRFVTLRVPGAGRPRAEARFAELVAALEALPFRVRARIREYTVYDSDVAVDRGWL
jgi:inosine/xanthosine triphosphate pyrophosphatase family protein